MTLSMGLAYKNPDASADINSRFKDVISKGFTNGGLLQPVSGSLEIDLLAFKMVNFDGAVVLSDATERRTIIDGQENYVVVRARHVVPGSPTLSIEVMTEAAYLADPENDWLHVAGVVDLSVGGPFTEATAAEIFYTERHTVDKLARNPWRESVANFAALPTGNANENRTGDTRLVRDTNTLYSWNGSAWQAFDEVALELHRTTEHSNGIVGQSDAATLEPGVSGTNLTIQDVPALSFYTIGGNLLSSPVSPVSVAASSVGAVRGLIEAAQNSAGGTTTGYRVQKDADPLDITYAKIVDVSRNHSLGSFNLVFTQATSTLAWNGGEPVTAVTAGEYTLYGPDYTEFIVVEISGAAPGVNSTDGYTINASLRSATTLLVGGWFWDGSSVLELKRDYRLFGNVSGLEISDDFKDRDLAPVTRETRPNGVFSGGVVTDQGGTTIRVTGPIVAYINGQRLVAPGAYGGIALPAVNGVHYLYVNEAGALVNSTTAPTGEYAEVNRILIISASIVTLDDRRETIVGLGSGAELSYQRNQPTAQDEFVLSTNGGVTTGFTFKTANVEAEDLDANGAITGATTLDVTGVATFGDAVNVDQRVVAQGGALQLADTNTGSDVAFSDATNTGITDRLPGLASPSILGVHAAAEESRRFGFGVKNGCAVVRNSDSEVQISTGEFFDFYGRKVTISSPEVLAIGSDGTFIISYSSASDSYGITAKTSNITHDSFPFAVVVRAAGVIDSNSGVVDCKMHACGMRDPLRLTVGSVTADSIQDQQFATLEQAMLHASCFSDTVPHEFIIEDDCDVGVTQSSVRRGIVATDAHWNGTFDTRFNNAKFQGAKSGFAPVLSWDALGPAIDVNFIVDGFRFSDLEFRFEGAGNGAVQVTAFRNAGERFRFDNVTFDGGDDLSSVFYWSGVAQCGDGWEFKNCSFEDVFDASVASGDRRFFHMASLSAGRIVFDTCRFGDSTIDWDTIVEYQTSEEFKTEFRNCEFVGTNASNSALIRDGVVNLTEVQHIFRNCEFTCQTGNTWIAGVGGSTLVFDGCTFNGTATSNIQFDNAQSVASCKITGSAPVFASLALSMSNCSLTDARLREPAVSTSDSFLGIDTSNPIESGNTDWNTSFSGCQFIGYGGSNTLFEVRGEMVFNNCLFYYDSGTGGGDNWIVVDNDGNATFTGCMIKENSTLGQFHRDDGSIFAVEGAGNLTVQGCVIFTFDADHVFDADTDTPDGNVTFSGNTITFNKTNTNMLQLSNLTNVGNLNFTFTNNTVSGSANTIGTLSSNGQVVFTGNNIDFTGSTSALSLNCNLMHATINNNCFRIDNDRAAGGLFQVLVGSGSTRAMVTFNGNSFYNSNSSAVDTVIAFRAPSAIEANHHLTVVGNTIINQGTVNSELILADGTNDIDKVNVSANTLSQPLVTISAGVSSTVTGTNI